MKRSNSAGPPASLCEALRAGRLFKKTNKILFSKVGFGKGKFKIIPMFLLCAGVFGVSAFASGKILLDYNQKEKEAEIYAVGNVLAAEKESDGENILPRTTGNYGSKAVVRGKPENSGRAIASVLGVADSVKKKLIKPKKIAPKVINAPPPRAETKKVNGLRVCAKKNDHGRESHKGSQPHMDRECCPDPDEWPNPHCYYTPEQLSRMLKPPK